MEKIEQINTRFNALTEDTNLGTPKLSKFLEEAKDDINLKNIEQPVRA
jgi:hypothetical protein